MPKLLFCIRILSGLVSCLALFSWLSSAAGNPDPVITPAVVLVLLALALIDLSCHLPSRVYARSMPGLIIAAFCIAGYMTGDDIPVVIASLLAVVTCLLSMFSSILDRIRRGGPFLVFLVFLIPMVIGAIVLTTPRCQQATPSLTPSEAIFTSISAVTVTGLTVIDVGRRLSAEGQWVLLLLIQLGGLGMVSLFAFFALVLGNGLGIRQGRAIRDSLDGIGSGQLRALLGTICLSTLVVELCGAALLMVTASDSVHIRENLFHSVSAFCNSGFTLNSDSLGGWSGTQKSIMAALIVIGGVGFPVLHEFKRRLLLRDIDRTSLQVRLVLSVTTVLLITGTLVLFLTGAGMDSWFWSVTCRTAGFSTSSPAGLPLAATLMVILLMMIGASPGSTGGGLKTSTVGVLFLATRSEMKGAQKVIAWKRTIPDAVIRTAAVLTLVGGALWLTLVTALLLVESEALQSGRLTFVDIVFEVTSALGTVGLSREVTSSLTEYGRWVIEFAMIIGRLGPLALVIAMASLSRQAPRGERPQGRVMLG
ncbi:MAG: potassium transporter TrkG [Planctomycetota bacterium]